MMTFTHITAAAILIGVVLAIIPVKWYKNSIWDFRKIGVWLVLFSISTQIFMWLGYLIYIYIYHFITQLTYSTYKT